MTLEAVANAEGAQEYGIKPGKPDQFVGWFCEMRIYALEYTHQPFLFHDD